MHPRYKTRYFTKECWPEEWIEEAISLAREIWNTHYRDSTPGSTVTTQAITRASRAAKVCCHSSLCNRLLCPRFHIASPSLIEIIVLSIIDILFIVWLNQITNIIF